MCSTEVGDLVVGEGERWMGKRQVLDKTLKVERIRPLWPGVGDGPRWDPRGKNGRDAVRWSWPCGNPDAREEDRDGVEAGERGS